MHQTINSRKKPAKVRLVPDRAQAANIFFYMKRSGVTQRQIAATAGVTQTFVSAVIYGKKTSGRVQKAIAQALGFDSWTALTAERKGVAA